MLRYSIYSHVDQFGLTSYMVTVQVLVGGATGQDGASQEPGGPNQDGPGPQDPPNGGQSIGLLTTGQQSLL